MNKKEKMVLGLGALGGGALALYYLMKMTGSSGGSPPGGGNQGYSFSSLSMTSQCGNIDITGVAMYNGQPLANASINAEYNAYYSGSMTTSPWNATTGSDGSFEISMPTASSTNSIWVWIYANGQQNGATNQIVQAQPC